jgi:hypothetical protein
VWSGIGEGYEHSKFDIAIRDKREGRWEHIRERETSGHLVRSDSLGEAWWDNGRGVGWLWIEYQYLSRGVSDKEEEGVGGLQGAQILSNCTISSIADS